MKVATVLLSFPLRKVAAVLQYQSDRPHRSPLEPSGKSEDFGKANHANQELDRLDEDREGHAHGIHARPGTGSTGGPRCRWATRYSAQHFKINITFITILNEGRNGEAGVELRTPAATDMCGAEAGTRAGWAW